MSQSKFESFIEANTNTFIGLGINLGASFLIYPLLGMADPIKDWWKFVVSTALFTVLSVTRSYYVRRFFNGKKDKRLIIRDREEPNHG